MNSFLPLAKSLKIGKWNYVASYLCHVTLSNWLQSAMNSIWFLDQKVFSRWIWKNIKEKSCFKWFYSNFCFLIQHNGIDWSMLLTWCRGMLYWMVGWIVIHILGKHTLTLFLCCNFKIFMIYQQFKVSFLQLLYYFCVVCWFAFSWTLCTRCLFIKSQQIISTYKFLVFAEYFN